MTELGHNAPPPLDAHAMHIDELYANAKDVLDGAPIESQGQAELVGQMLAAFREARKGADAQRAIEKKPHDDASAAVQAAWRPLIAKCETAERIAKNAIGSWQIKLEAEQRAEAQRLAHEAERTRASALELAQAQRGSERLEDAERAEAAIKAADRLAKDAARADKAKPLVATGGRSVGLRSEWIPELVDSAVALRFYRERQPEALKEWLLDQASKDVRSGLREIPGFKISEERKAV